MRVMSETTAPRSVHVYRRYQTVVMPSVIRELPRSKIEQSITDCHLIVYENAALLHSPTLYVMFTNGRTYNPVGSSWKPELSLPVP